MVPDCLASGVACTSDHDEVGFEHPVAVVVRVQLVCDPLRIGFGGRNALAEAIW